MKRFALIVALTFVGGNGARAEPVLPAFDPAAFEPGAAVTHPYFALKPGAVREYSGEVTEGGEIVTERSVRTVVGAGPDLAGVKTVMVVDQVFLDGRLVEQAKDYYAQDRAGNVWYMGEDVINISYDDDDKVVGVDDTGTWRAGLNGAWPGYQMPAVLKPGFAYEQEHSVADNALDRGEIMAVDGTMQGPLGGYDKVLAVFETSAVEPDLREIKYYAPGVGLIGEDGAVDGNRANPETHFALIRRQD